MAAVEMASAGFGGLVRFDMSEAACSVGFDVARRFDDWPLWPWLVEGAQVDISLWDSGADTRGGDPLWMVVRDTVTDAPLMTIYQLNGSLIEDGQFRDEVGLEVSLVGPVCETWESGVLGHVYDLDIAFSGMTATLAHGEEGALPSSAAPYVWKIQTGVLANTFGHLIDPNDAVFDLRVGEYFQFVAWTEPRCTQRLAVLRGLART